MDRRRAGHPQSPHDSRGISSGVRRWLPEGIRAGREAVTWHSCELSKEPQGRVGIVCLFGDTGSAGQQASPDKENGGESLAIKGQNRVRILREVVKKRHIAFEQ
jgi:hypothetical protein